MYVLLVGGVLGIFLVPFDLLYDPELLTQLSSGRLFSIVSVVLFYFALESVLSLAAGIGIRLKKNWGRVLGAIVLLFAPLSFLLNAIAYPIEEDIRFALLTVFALFSLLFVALGIALFFFDRSKRFFGVLPDPILIETPPPPPEFD